MEERSDKPVTSPRLQDKKIIMASVHKIDNVNSLGPTIQCGRNMTAANEKYTHYAPPLRLRFSKPHGGVTREIQPLSLW